MSVEAKSECRLETISKFVGGELGQTETRWLEEHLESCEACQQRLFRESGGSDLADQLRSHLENDHASTGHRGGDTAGEDLTGLTAGQPTDGQTGSDAVLTFLNPTDDPRMMGRFGGYEICGVIGHGGAGLVLKGLDVSLDRYVAIKVLHPSLAHNEDAIVRFAREAQAAAAVVHDNVIGIHGVDRCNGLPYLVMPYINGTSLQGRINDEGPMPLDEMLRISLQVARGLAAAHDQGLIHRDIKPANILTPRSVSRVLITDFGLARSVGESELTRTGIVAGTPQYMSPEQAEGSAVDKRTDLFSLGGVMYAMATGRPPFDGDSPYTVIRRIIDTDHVSVAEHRSDLPEWFLEIVDRLLAKPPADRFESADSLAEHLEDCLAHLQQPQTVELPRSVAPAKRRPSSVSSRGWKSIAAAVSVLAVLLFAMVSPFSHWLSDSPDDPWNDRSGDPAVVRGASAIGTESQNARPSDTSVPSPSAEASPKDLPNPSFDLELFDDSSWSRVRDELRTFQDDPFFEPDDP